MAIRFGTSGWRAVISDEFTFSNVKRVAQAIAEFIKSTGGRQVIVARDTRFMTERYAQIVSEVMAGNGIKVLMPENPTPTPVVSFAIRSLELSGGINITASHNPPEYCGIKFNPSNGTPAAPDTTKKIEDIIDKIKPDKIHAMSLSRASNEGLFEIIDPKPQYIKTLSEIVDFERIKAGGLRVICDLLYGAAINYLDELCQNLCADCNVVHNYRNAYFGGDRPEPDEDRLREYSTLVRDGGWDIVIATDGDADRFGIMDDTGSYVKPNEIIALLAHHLYVNKNMIGPVARSISTSHAVDAVASEFNQASLETPVGFKYLANMILSENAVIAGEESGGLSIQNHIPEKDGILACLLVLEMLAYEQKPLSAIRKDFQEKYGAFYNTRIDIAMESMDQKREMLKHFAELDSFCGMKIVDHDNIDGFRYLFEEAGSWLLIRESGTEPVLRIYVESKSKEVFQRMISSVRELSRRFAST